MWSQLKHVWSTSVDQTQHVGQTVFSRHVVDGIVVCGRHGGSNGREFFLFLTLERPSQLCSHDRVNHSTRVLDPRNTRPWLLVMFSVEEGEYQSQLFSLVRQLVLPDTLVVFIAPTESPSTNK